MIKSNHSILADKFFKIYIFRLLKKNFHSINLIGEIPYIPNNYPIINAPNHSTWWDGFFVYLLNDLYFQRKFYIMILEEQLIKYKFFTKLGGFSINKNNPKSIIESLKYISEQIKINPLSVTTIFPQGELLPNYIRPLNFNRGIEKIVTMYGEFINILPLSIRIEYLNEEKPTVFFKYGELLTVNKNDSGYTDKLSVIVTNNLDEIGNSILSRNFGSVLLEGKTSVSNKSISFFEPFKKSQIDGIDK
jgi:chlorobactene lauroyltransferase